MMEDSKGIMYALASVMTGLAIVAVVLRFHARRITKIALSGDDFLILLALLFTIGTGVCMIIGAAIGDLGEHTRTTPDGFPIIDNHTVIFFQIIYATQLTQTLTFGLTKLAVLLFYRRIFTGKLFRYITWAMIGLVTAWTVAFFAANLLQCLPISDNWAIIDVAPGACIEEIKMYLAQAGSDVVTDVMILSLPIPSIWALQMKMKRKIAISGMFLLGALTVAAGAAKLAAFYHILNATYTGAMDVTYILTPTIYWPMVESSLGIVGACLPLMRPICDGYSPMSLIRSLKSAMSSSNVQNLGNSKDSIYAKETNDHLDKARSTEKFTGRQYQRSHEVHAFDHYFDEDEHAMPLESLGVRATRKDSVV